MPALCAAQQQSLAMMMEEAGRAPQGTEEEQAAIAIANRLNGLPLALELAGAYLLYRSLSWREYLRILEGNLGAALPQKLASFTKHEADLFATLKIQEAILADEPHLREILDFLTWSAPVNMGLSLLSASLATDEAALLGPVREKVLGSEHPLTADSVSHTVGALIALGRRKEAFDLLDPFLKSLPENHSKAENLEALRADSLKKPLKPGFRQPSAKKKTRRKKGKRRK